MEEGEDGEWTYIGENGASVIDYVICNQEAVQEIERLKVGDRTDPDHMPLEAILYGTRVEGKRIKEEEKEIERRE